MCLIHPNYTELCEPRSRFYVMPRGKDYTLWEKQDCALNIPRAELQPSCFGRLTKAIGKIMVKERFIVCVVRSAQRVQTDLNLNLNTLQIEILIVKIYLACIFQFEHSVGFGC
jgi:hypothetical protein